MPDTAPFIEAARSQGFGGAAAEATMATVQARLGVRGIVAARLYCFRTAGAGGDGAAPAPPPARPRLLLAFSSADAALGFAQRQGLGFAPRLVVLSLPQALATLLQRPAIGALLIADEDTTDAPGLPLGLRVERGELIELLAGQAS